MGLAAQEAWPCPPCPPIRQPLQSRDDRHANQVVPGNGCVRTIHAGEHGIDSGAQRRYPFGHDRRHVREEACLAGDTTLTVSERPQDRFTPPGRPPPRPIHDGRLSVRLGEAGGRPDCGPRGLVAAGNSA